MKDRKVKSSRLGCMKWTRLYFNRNAPEQHISNGEREVVSQEEATTKVVHDDMKNQSYENSMHPSEFHYGSPAPGVIPLLDPDGLEGKFTPLKVRVNGNETKDSDCIENGDVDDSEEFAIDDSSYWSSDSTVLSDMTESLSIYSESIIKMYLPNEKETR